MEKYGYNLYYDTCPYYDDYWYWDEDFYFTIDDEIYEQYEKYYPKKQKVKVRDKRKHKKRIEMK